MVGAKNSLSSFGHAYIEARNLFRQAAHAAGCELEHRVCPGTGPSDEELTVDIAWLGRRDASKVLVLLSGVHGAEGLFGSGVQVDFLARCGAAKLTVGTAALIVHGINPHGFAWMRRTTQENVDLNRNWVNFSGPLPTNEGYDTLANAIVPSEWTPEAQSASREVLQTYADKFGFKALQRAVHGGQYRHPSGIFFGGFELCWSRIVLTDIFERYLRDAVRVGLIDFHTGIGSWGEAVRMNVAPAGSSASERTLRWFGLDAVSPFDDTSPSTRKSGGCSEASIDLLKHAEVTTLTLEIGTVPLIDVVMALREDAWIYENGLALSPAGEAARVRMRAVYFDDDPTWQSMALAASRLTIRQAIAGLAADG